MNKACSTLLMILWIGLSAATEVSKQPIDFTFRLAQGPFKSMSLADQTVVNFPPLHADFYHDYPAYNRFIKASFKPSAILGFTLLKDAPGNLSGFTTIYGQFGTAEQIKNLYGTNIIVEATKDANPSVKLTSVSADQMATLDQEDKAKAVRIEEEARAAITAAQATLKNNTQAILTILQGKKLAQIQDLSNLKTLFKDWFEAIDKKLKLSVPQQSWGQFKSRLTSFLNGRFQGENIAAAKGWAETMIADKKYKRTPEFKAYMLPVLNAVSSS